MRLSLVASLFAFAFGCAESTPEVRPTPSAVPAGTYVVALTVDGPEAEPGKRQRCEVILERNGIAVRPDAAVMVQLTLMDGRNLARVFRRFSVSNFQLLREERKPDSSMGEICTSLVRDIQAALSSPPPGPAPAPPPGYAMPPGAGQPPPGAGQPPPSYGAPPPRYAQPPPSTPGPAPAAPIVLDPLPAAAALPGPADARLQQGLQLFSRGDFAGALAAFAEAHRLSGDANLLFDMGLSYVRLRRNVEALQYLQLFLDRRPATPNRAAVEAQIRELRRQQGDDD